jgi:hypothetical protein
MARPVENIKDLNDSKYLWKLAVLVKDLWVVNNAKGVKHVEMVLTDKMVCYCAHVIIFVSSPINTCSLFHVLDDFFRAMISKLLFLLI